jgi:hypothetical protein
MIKERISFHGKEMNLLGAKLYASGLKFRIIKPKLIQNSRMRRI